MARIASDRSAAAAFDAISVEGGLIAPAMLARIARHDAEAQKDADYRVPKGLSLRDEIARYFRIGQAHFLSLTASETPSAAATIAFVEELLRDVFGFADVRRMGTRTIGDRQFAVTLEVLGGRVPILVVPPTDDLDRPSVELAVDGRRRSAASALQEWLNADEDALWGLCTNGLRLRLVRDNASLTRPAYIEADLRRMFEADGFADFATLWLLIHASRFGSPGSLPTECVLERWRDAGQKEGRRALDKLSISVEAALLALGNGFVSHPDNNELRDNLRSGAMPLQEFFGELLRLIYRLIFLLAAEDRDLLHPPGAEPAAKALYIKGYSVAALRESAVRRSAWDHHRDRWEGLLVTFAALSRGEPRLALPALGGLFASDATPALDAARLANRALMEAIFRLAWLRDDSNLAPVNWRDMETEELGSVYESLLELTPLLSDDGHAFAFAEGGEAKGHARKTSGSYYTPDSLVQELLDSALDPVLDRVEAEATDRAAALLSVTVLDPACGSGHFLLGAARRIAARLARVRTGGVASAEHYRHALRDVVRASIHGVDRNPMAIELAKVALWIETVEPGKPLGFLDANLRCGDSLLGIFDLAALRTGIPDAAYKPLAGDDKATAKWFEKRNKAERAGQGAFDFGRGGSAMPPAAPLVEADRALRAMPEDSPEQVEERRRRYEAGRADPGRWSLRVAADLYVAAFLVPKTGGVPEDRNTVTIPTTAHVWDALGGHMPYGPMVGSAQDTAEKARAFHWPLEFADVMAAGGFDVVLGNPPWEVIQLGEEEYFSQRIPEIAQLPGAQRKRAILHLKVTNPNEYLRYEAEKRRYEAGNEFVRSSGRFSLTARGKINTYSLFAEFFSSVASSSARAGIIVPTGICTNETTSQFFFSLIRSRRLISLIAFDEIKNWFPGTKDNQSFCEVVIGPHNDEPQFTFNISNLNGLKDERRRFSLNQEQLISLNPNTKTAPVFRSRADANLVAKIYSHNPVLIDENQKEDGDPWEMRFSQGLFNMTSDSGLFRTAAQLAQEGYQQEHDSWIPIGVARSDRDIDRYIPLYEAKMVHQFDHRFGMYPAGHIEDTRALPRPTLVDKANQEYEVTPRYWIPQREVDSRLGELGWRQSWLIGWRDVTNSTNERTVICAASPRVGFGHKFLLLLPQKIDKICALIGCLNSLVLDYCARQKLNGTSFNYFLMKQLPIVSPNIIDDHAANLINPRVLELTYTARSMAPFARDLGFHGAPFSWNEDRRALLRAELDAWYARAYGLTRDELRYILDPADLMGPDYPSETFRVLKKNEIARYGEYRTAKLVLQAWDRLARAEL